MRKQLRPLRFGLLLLFTLTGCTSALPRPRLEPHPSPLEIQPTPASALTATFLGTSSLLIDDGEHVIVVDGFVSRPSPLRLALGPVSSDEDLVATVIGDDRLRRASTVLVAHAHHDHVMDVAALVRGSNAVVWGSAGVDAVLKAQGVPSARRKVVGQGATVQVPAPFRIDVFSTPHSQPELFSGDIGPDFTAPAPVWRYRGGENLSFAIHHPRATILVVASADPDHAEFAHLEADVVFLGVGSLGRREPEKIRRLWCAAVIATGARWVVPIHWDDFFQPLRAPLPAAPYAFDRVDRALRALETFASADGVGFARMDAFNAVDLEAAAASPRSSVTPPADCLRTQT